MGFLPNREICAANKYIQRIDAYVHNYRRKCFKHIAQHSDELNLQIGLKTMKSGIRILISVQIIQVDPCGSGWEKMIKRQQSHIYTVF